MGQFAEVGSKTNGHEGQGEEVAAESLGDGEHTLVDEGIVEVGTNLASDGGEQDGGSGEAEHELGEAVPDFHGADGLAVFVLFNLGSKVDSDAEGGHADEDVLDHLDGSGNLQGLGAEEGASGGHGAGGVNGTTDPGATEHFGKADELDEGGHGNHHDGGEHHGEADGQGQFFLLSAAGGGNGDSGGGTAHGHVGGDGDVQGLGGHLQDLLAEDVGAAENDGGNHPGNEDAGDTDGEDLVEENFSTEEHEAGLDVVFNLHSGLEPLGGADGVGDDHTGHDSHDFAVHTVLSGGLVAAEHVGEAGQSEHTEEADEVADEVVAHDDHAEPGDHTETDGEDDETGNLVGILADGLLSLVSSLNVLLPGLDGGFGGLVQVGILEVGGSGGVLSDLSGSLGGLGLSGGFLSGGFLVGLLVADEGIHGVAGPLAGLAKVADEGLGGGQLGTGDALLGGLSVDELDGLEGLSLFGGDDSVLLFDLGGDFVTAVHHDEAGNDDDEETDPNGPVVFLEPKVRPFRTAVINNDVGISSHIESPA